MRLAERTDTCINCFNRGDFRVCVCCKALNRLFQRELQAGWGSFWGVCCVLFGFGLNGFKRPVSQSVSQSVDPRASVGRCHEQTANQSVSRSVVRPSANRPVSRSVGRYVSTPIGQSVGLSVGRSMRRAPGTQSISPRRQRNAAAATTTASGSWLLGLCHTSCNSRTLGDPLI